jgi:hypothetical protein
MEKIRAYIRYWVSRFSSRTRFHPGYLMTIASLATRKREAAESILRLTINEEKGMARFSPNLRVYIPTMQYTG